MNDKKRLKVVVLVEYNKHWRWHGRLRFLQALLQQALCAA